MTVEEYFEEWWAPKELLENRFDKTAMLDFAEMYHKQALRIHDVVGQSEQLKCHHQYMNAGTLQGDAMKKCLKCGDYVKAL